MRIPITAVFPARASPSRLLGHALAAWALGALLLLVVMATCPRTLATAFFTLGAPVLTTAVAALYFRRGETPEPLTVALVFTLVAGALDRALLVAAGSGRELLEPTGGFGLGLLLVFGATGLTGELIAPTRRAKGV